MVFIKIRHSDAGFSQGGLIWLAVIICFGMIVKNEFFSGGISAGTSIDELLYQYGQPAAKSVVPRPG